MQYQVATDRSQDALRMEHNEKRANYWKYTVGLSTSTNLYLQVFYLQVCAPWTEGLIPVGKIPTDLCFEKVSNCQYPSAKNPWISPTSTGIFAFFQGLVTMRKKTCGSISADLNTCMLLVLTSPGNPWVSAVLVDSHSTRSQARSYLTCCTWSNLAFSRVIYKRFFGWVEMVVIELSVL